MNHSAFFDLLSKGDITGAYLFTGLEEFVKESALEKLLSSIEPSTRDLNVSSFESSDATALIDAAEALPFFSEKRVVICRTLPKETDAKRIADYIPGMPESTVLIFFIRGEADGRSILVKALGKAGRCVSFDPLSQSELIRWLSQQAKKLSVTISPDAARFLVERVGVELTVLNNEFTKCACYVGSGLEITREAIVKCTTHNAEYRVFDMIDCFLSGKKENGLRALDKLIADGEPPMRIAALLESRFRLMLSARAMIDERIKKDIAIKRMGGSEYAARKAYEAASRMQPEKLRTCLSAFADVSYMQISGQMRDRDALELALIAIS